MKLTKETLKQIIKEELDSVMDEGHVALGPEDMGIAYYYNPEQQKVLKHFAKRLNGFGDLFKDQALQKITYYLKNEHPAFKGFKGEQKDLQNGLKKYGYKGPLMSTFAVMEDSSDNE